MEKTKKGHNPRKGGRGGKKERERTGTRYKAMNPTKEMRKMRIRTKIRRKEHR